MIYTSSSEDSLAAHGRTSASSSRCNDEAILSKGQIIKLLAKMRAGYRTIDKRETTLGFRQVAIDVLFAIEDASPPNSLWSSSPDEAELTEHSSIGDHLNVTRRVLNLMP